ncbi:anaphase-promoting complex subunit cdc20-like [Diadema setosum]|uniref:anaphase-promoting complex subunit cdc20-like n=1 Tax=Diadema setosum TaxID=31175 RepID=UPI003B3B5BF0
MSSAITANVLVPSILDRFIPNRGALDLDLAEFLLSRTPSNPANRHRHGSTDLSDLSDDSFSSTTTSNSCLDALDISGHGSLNDSSPRTLNLLSESSIQMLSLAKGVPDRSAGECSGLYQKRFMMCRASRKAQRGELVFAFKQVVYTWHPPSTDIQVVYEPERRSDFVQINCVGWHDDATLVATAALEHLKPVVTLSNPDSIIRTHYDMVPLESSAYSLQWNRSGLMCGCRDGGVYHYDTRIRSHKPGFTFKRHDTAVLTCHYDKDVDLLATGDSSGHLMIWERRQPREPLHEFLNAHAGPITAMSWCPWQPGLLATGNVKKEPTLKFWNLITGLKSKERRVENEITSLQWFEAEHELISGHASTTDNILFWKYPSLRPSRALRFHSDSVMNLALSRFLTTTHSVFGILIPRVNRDEEIP